MEYNEFGIKALQEGAYEKAIEAFMKAAEEEPDNPVGYINLGNVFASPVTRKGRNDFSKRRSV